MADFLTGLFAWLVLCLCVFLALSGLLSFVGLEWRWAGESVFERIFLAVLWLYCSTYVKWSER